MDGVGLLLLYLPIVGKESGSAFAFNRGHLPFKFLIFCPGNIEFQSQQDNTAVIVVGVSESWPATTSHVNFLFLFSRVVHFCHCLFDWTYEHPQTWIKPAVCSFLVLMTPLRKIRQRFPSVQKYNLRVLPSDIKSHGKNQITYEWTVLNCSTPQHLMLNWWSAIQSKGINSLSRWSIHCSLEQYGT